MNARVVKLRVTGRVQGVGYRWWTVNEAQQLGLQGWVRNRHDGTVEILASGDAALVEALIAAARKGPTTAEVEAVTVEDAPGDPVPPVFEQRPSV